MRRRRNYPFRKNLVSNEELSSLTYYMRGRDNFPEFKQNLGILLRRKGVSESIVQEILEDARIHQSELYDISLESANSDIARGKIRGYVETLITDALERKSNPASSLGSIALAGLAGYFLGKK